MSISGQIMDHLANKNSSDLSTLDPSRLAEELGAGGADRMSKLLWSLEHTGRIELIRSGRSITGIARVVRVGRKNRVAQTGSRSEAESRPGFPRGPQPIRGTKTPQTDRYEAAKQRAKVIKGDDEYIQVTFREDPLAEEAVKLKEALAKLQTDYADLSTKYRALLWENTGIKDRMKQRAEASVHAYRAEADRTD